MKNSFFLAEALVEMVEAAKFYETQTPGLGQDFLLEIYSAKEMISKNPLAWAELEPGIRRCMASRFPYGILYQMDEADIIITSVMHLKRRPGYWKERLNRKRNALNKRQP